MTRHVPNKKLGSKTFRDFSVSIWGVNKPHLCLDKTITGLNKLGLQTL